MIGQTISHYKILEELGAGGMGVVYQAEDTKLKRTVALKFLPPELTRDKDAKTRFIREAQAASALQHNNICAIHEIDETEDGRMFISMDCYEGETLKEKISRGPLPINEAVDIVAQVAEGLEEAHKAGMIHRDIKPANIMITNDGVVKIVDFGLAKLAGRTKVTKTGTTVGTVMYMSPEQVTGHDVDARSDLFSLGSILYEMLSGCPPFTGEHDVALQYQIVNADVSPLSDGRSDVSPALDAIVGKALEKEPESRYQTAAELNQDIHSLRAAVAGSSHSGKRANMRGGARLTWIGVVTVLIVALVVTVWQSRRETGTVSAGEMSLAVVEFRDMAAQPDTLASAVLTELLNTALVEVCPIRVQSPEYVRDIQRRLYGATRTKIEEGQELEIAKKAEATYVLTGRMGMVDDERFVTWRLIDLATGRSIGADRASPGKMSAMVDEVVASVLPRIADATGIATPSDPEPVEQITTASASAYEYYVLGKVRHVQYQLEDAREAYEKAVSADSSFALAYLGSAKLYYGERMLYQDIALARRYAAAAWRHADRLGIKDKMHLRAYQLDLDAGAEPITPLREILERWPDDRESFVALLTQLYYHWDWRGAVELTQQGAVVYPSDPEIGGAIYSAALGQLGRYEDSYLAARDFVGKFPDNPRAWRALAMSYLALGLPDSAEIAYQKAFADGEELAYCEYHRGDLGGAIAILEEMLSEEDLSDGRRCDLMCNFTHSFHLAALLVESGRHADAVRVTQDAQRYGSDAFWQYQEGALLAHVGLPDQALAIAQQMEASEDVRTQIFALRFKGHAQVAAGDLAGARETAIVGHDWGERERAYMKHVAHVTDAKIALAEGDPSAAMKALEKVEWIGQTFLNMTHIDYLTMLASAQEMAGRLDDAIGVHEETLRIYGGHALSHYELGRLYEAVGRAQDARAEFTRFLEMWSDADEGLPQVEDARARLAALDAGS